MAYHVLGGLLVASLAHKSTTPSLPSPTDIVREIYRQSPSPRLVVYLTGGGTELVPWMLATPGASRTVLDLQVPYSQRALSQLLKDAPLKRCCVPDVARQMAIAAYARARELQDPTAAEGEPPCVGLGCTAALQTNDA